MSTDPGQPATWPGDYTTQAADGRTHQVTGSGWCLTCTGRHDGLAPIAGDPPGILVAIPGNPAATQALTTGHEAYVATRRVRDLRVALAARQARPLPDDPGARRLAQKMTTFRTNEALDAHTEAARLTESWARLMNTLRDEVPDLADQIDMAVWSKADLWPGTPAGQQ